MLKLNLALPMTDARRIVPRLIEENPSANTEPVLRIVAEGKEGDVEELIETLKQQVLGLSESGRS